MKCWIWPFTKINFWKGYTESVKGRKEVQSVMDLEQLDVVLPSYIENVYDSKLFVAITVAYVAFYCKTNA